ncbi:MAG: NRDE family protein [Pseudomonadales bacterium]
MCTLTWGYSQDGYHIHFNRDESRLRPKGTSPDLHIQNGVRFLAPIDPQAQGSWILCNQHGFSACLLNNYIDITPVDGQRSRGLLVRDLSCALNINEAISRISAEDISRYQPFDAFLFDRTECCEVNWNGRQMRINPETELRGFKSSSGFDAANVIAGRRSQFQQVGENRDSLRDFHRSHFPEKSAYSVCMHREDACTQSYTEILITAKTAKMSYIDGSPCSGILSGELELPLKTQ